MTLHGGGRGKGPPPRPTPERGSGGCLGEREGTAILVSGWLIGWTLENMGHGNRPGIRRRGHSYSLFITSTSLPIRSVDSDSKLVPVSGLAGLSVTTNVLLLLHYVKLIPTRKSVWCLTYTGYKMAEQLKRTFHGEASPFPRPPPSRRRRSADNEIVIRVLDVPQEKGPLSRWKPMPELFADEHHLPQLLRHQPPNPSVDPQRPKDCRCQSHPETRTADSKLAANEPQPHTSPVCRTIRWPQQAIRASLSTSLLLLLLQPATKPLYPGFASSPNHTAIVCPNDTAQPRSSPVQRNMGRLRLSIARPRAGTRFQPPTRHATSYNPPVAV